ncbi:hypothetical protein [Kutzneria chonburiensis]|uniref:MBG domain-containing protein n=1 Tax=Kutzneria chonburiensis TaxID=1483604 RepID=A0ABV6N301_9PSEU|nr:hypothetical protein [Kutzneria chonburiensis]
MAWDDSAYGVGTVAGTIANLAVPGQQPAPPIPGGTTLFTYTAQTPVAPWSYWGWSAGGVVGLYPGGGVVVAPAPASGTVSVTAWWPDAPNVLLVRITPDGTRTPVRGAYPLTAGASRRNYSPNPSFEAGLNGCAAGTGNPTLTQISRTGDPTAGAYALRATVAAAGTDEVTLPSALSGGVVVTVGVDLRLSARPTALTITVQWTSATGTGLPSTSVTLTADAVNPSVAQWARQVVTVTPPATAATSALKITATGMPAGGTLDVDRVTLEQAATDGSYVAGDSTGGVWTGTTALSTSVIAPVLTVADGEAPLDIALTYEVYNPAITGGRVKATPVVLASTDTAWLTHPATPAAPLACQPTVTPALVRGLDQAVFRVLGRANPVVVSAAKRVAPSGTLSLSVTSFAARDALLALLADGSPLLLRTPSAYGYGAGLWLAFADVTEDPGPLATWQQTRTITAPFQVVDRPAAANSVIV